MSKEEFDSRVENLNLRAKVGLEAAKEQFFNFIKEHSVPHIYSDRQDGISGNYLYACENILDSFHCFNCSGLVRSRDLFDAKFCLEANGYGDGLSNSAQVVSVGTNAHDLVNCIDCHTNVSHLTYCIGCESSSNLFGCVGLKDAEYCILNKQYKKRQYEKIKNKIVELLKADGSYGSFFPRVFSPYAYNHSAAHQIMPLSKVQAETLRFIWEESAELIRPSQILAAASGHSPIEIKEIPNTMDEIDPETLSNVNYLCELSGKLFQIHQDELALHQKLGVSFVSRSFEQRHLERLRRLSPQRMSFIKSSKSETFIRTAFPEKWKHPVVSWSEWRENVDQHSFSAGA